MPSKHVMKREMGEGGVLKPLPPQTLIGVEPAVGPQPAGEKLGETAL